MNGELQSAESGNTSNLKCLPVLVTGGSGFIGANLVRKLLAEQAHVHVLQRPGTNAWRLAECAQHITVHEAVIGDSPGLTPLIGAIKPRAIFHLATARGTLVQNRHNYMQTGLLGAAQLVDALREYPECRLIVAGSSLEYAPCDGAILETHPLAPNTLHGAVKAAASLLYQHAATTACLAITQLRLFHVYGPWESPHRFLPVAIRLAMAGQPIPLVRGESRRDWVHVDDVVVAMLLAAAPRAPTGVFNIAGGREYSNTDVLDALQDILQIPVETVPDAFAARPTDSPHRFADIALARDQLNWTPEFDFMQGIQNTVAWWRNHPAIVSKTDAAPLAC